MHARAKIFTNGGSQAVRLPKQFRLKASEVEIWREGDEIRMRPVGEADSWQKMFEEIDAVLGGDFPEVERAKEFERSFVLDDPSQDRGLDPKR